MGSPYSADFRERVVAAIDTGISTGQAAKRFSVSKAAAGAWSRLKRATGSVAPPRQGKPAGSVLNAHADFILGVLDETPDTTMTEIAARFAGERGVSVVHTAVWKFLDRRGMTHRKRLRMQANSNALT